MVGVLRVSVFTMIKTRLILAKAVNVSINSFVLTGLRQHGKGVSK